MSRHRTQSSAAVMGAGAAFGVSILGGAAGSWIESHWNTVVISWEMAGLMISLLVTVCGFFVGAAAGMIRGAFIGTALGVLITGACVAAISLTNGSPRAVAIWSIAVGVCSGAAAGVVGGTTGKQRRAKMARNNGGGHA